VAENCDGGYASSGRILALAAVLVLIWGVRARAEGMPANPPGFAESRAIAEDGFIYGLSIVMNYAVMYEYVVDHNSGQWKAPFNTISNEHRVFTYKDTTVITPNSDTPYSLVWMDLRAEPIVVSVPAVEKSRYYSVQFTDGNTFNYGYIGSRATGNEAGDYMVVGPEWKGQTQQGIKKVFRSTTDFSAALFRTQLFNPEDMPNVEKVQSGYKVQPLSAYLHQPAPPPAPVINFPKINDKLVKVNFFEYLRFRSAIRAARARRERHPRQARQDRHRPRQDFQLQRPFAQAQARNRSWHEGWREEGRAET
jgi:hypothetical protein